MNIAFSRVLKVGEMNLEFNFRKLSADYSSYYVDVTDLNGQRIVFSIYKAKDDVWRSTGNRLPLWLAAFETELGKVVEEEEAQINY